MFFACLFSASTFAATPLLQKHVTNGYSIPPSSFTYDCSINNDRKIIVTKRENSDIPQTTVRRLTWRALYHLRSLVHFASRGTISDAPILCDGGDQLVYGFHHGTKFIIDEDKDCGPHKINESRSAERLKILVGRYCRI